MFWSQKHEFLALPTKSDSSTHLGHCDNLYGSFLPILLCATQSLLCPLCEMQNVTIISFPWIDVRKLIKINVNPKHHKNEMMSNSRLQYLCNSVWNNNLLLLLINHGQNQQIVPKF